MTRGADTVDSSVGFTWGFLSEMAGWTLKLAAVAAAVGLLVLRDPSFALGCLIGAGGDVAMVRAAAKSGQSAIEEGRFDGTSGAILLGGRVLFKGVLLAIAVFAPNTLDFVGTVVGVLSYDVTLAVVGSAVALRRVVSGSGEGR